MTEKEYTKDELIGYIKASFYRQRILLALSAQDMTPSEIAKSTKISLGNVTKIISDLRRKELVKCKTPRLRKGRIYTLTGVGKEIVAYLMSK